MRGLLHSLSITSIHYVVGHAALPKVITEHSSLPIIKPWPLPHHEATLNPDLLTPSWTNIHTPLNPLYWTLTSKPHTMNLDLWTPHRCFIKPWPLNPTPELYWTLTSSPSEPHTVVLGAVVFQKLKNIELVVVVLQVSLVECSIPMQASIISKHMGLKYSIIVY